MDTLPLVAPEQVGLSAARLDRVRTVDAPLGRQRQAGRHDGRGDAPRRARLRRDLRQGRPRAQQADAARHDLPHLLDDQAAHLDGDHDALRGGPLSARRPDLEVHPRLRQSARLCRRQPRQDRQRAGRARDHLPRPADPHLGPDLRLHGEQPRRRALPRQGRRRRLPDRRHQPQGHRRAAGDLPADRPARQGMELQRRHRRAGLPRRGDFRPALREVPEARRCSTPLGMVDTDFHVPAEKHERFAANYQRRPRRQARADRRSRQEPLPRPAQGQLRRRRPGLDGVGLPPLLPLHAEQGRTRRRAPARPQDGRADDHEPSQGRHGRHGHAALLGIDLLRHRLRPRLLGHDRPGQGPHPRHARRVRLGRRRLDRLLDRSRRRTWPWCC